MKKLFLLIAILVIAVGQLAAQTVSICSEYIPKYNKTLYGLKDNITGKWVVSPNYPNICKIGSYQGEHYYGLMNYDRLWGIITSKDFSKLKVNHQFDEIQYATVRQSGVPILLVRKGALWGVIELYTDKCQCVFDFSYSDKCFELLLDNLGIAYDELFVDLNKLVYSTEYRNDYRIDILLSFGKPCVRIFHKDILDILEQC